jgi:hypothetical protein
MTLGAVLLRRTMDGVRRGLVAVAMAGGAGRRPVRVAGQARRAALATAEVVPMALRARRKIPVAVREQLAVKCIAVGVEDAALVQGHDAAITRLRQPTFLRASSKREHDEEDAHGG